MFRKNEPDPSPIIKKSGPKVKKHFKHKVMASSEEEEDSTDVDDDLTILSLTPKKARPRRIVKNPVVDSDDELSSQVCVFFCSMVLMRNYLPLCTKLKA